MKRFFLCSLFGSICALSVSAADGGVSVLRSAAEAGNMDAANQLGMSYFSGLGVRKDLSEAARWVSMAAQKNHAVAQVNLAAMYERGDGVPQDERQALDWYLKAAKQGNPLAQVLLGAKYEYGEGTEANPSKAFRWYRKAAEQDHPRGQYHLGLLYLCGSGVKKDSSKAFFWLSLASDHSGEDVEAFGKALDAAKDALEGKDAATIARECEKWRSKNRRPESKG